MVATYGFYFEQPWWLLSGLLTGPLMWLAWRSLRPLGGLRRALAMILRAAVVLILAAVLARPTLTKTHDQVTLLTVVDRSQSVPADLQAAGHAYLARALEGKPAGDQLAVVDVAEAADITRLASTAADVPKRTLSLTGEQSRLAAGVQMALAIAPPNTAVRILLISDGNETAGDLRAVARVAAANGIPIDVLPLRYRHEKEVVFRRLVAPGRARSNQTIPLRFVLTSTHACSGQLLLTLNGRPVDLAPETPAVTAPVSLKAGTNVQSVSLPVGTQGVHEFDVRYLPDDANADRLVENNRASAVTFVAGPGHVLVVSSDAREAAAVLKALRDAGMDARGVTAGQFPERLTGLLDADAVVLVNVPNHELSLAQQEMLCRYVSDLGGGLVTVGGPDAYGAGGWIGSPVADILPVDMDPPQKKQMPKGALVLIMHACEMPRGNYWGKQVATAAVKSLSRHDLVGVLDFSWSSGGRNWVYPLGPAGDKKAPVAAINRMVMGDMPDFGPPVEAALASLKAARAGQKHVIIISDGDPALPKPKVIQEMRKSRITCTGVAVFPHSPQDVASLQFIAARTGGRFYDVKDPSQLPQIFVKEAQVVRRSLIIEDAFQPRVVSGLSEILRGVRALPSLDGRVLTGPKRGLSQLVLASPDGDPVLATVQSGLGRVASFTSSADSRWAAKWLAWAGFERFWEQTLRWAAKSPQSADCETFADVQGRSVALTVEAVRPGGAFVQFADLTAQVIAPDMSAKPVELRQVGPGQYRANFQAPAGGSYLVNLRYRKTGEGEKHKMAQSVVTVPFAPEFEDLTDNAPLLAELAETTGGRILPAKPDKADLFSRAALTPPRTPTALTKPLFIAWVILFLLDVAARRVIVDVRAMARRVAAAFHGKRSAGESETLAALKSRRQRVRERLAGQKEPDARRRFTAGEGAPTELPEADVSRAAPTHRPETAEPAAGDEPPPLPAEQTHVSRLLDAKRRARDKKKGK